MEDTAGVQRLQHGRLVTQPLLGSKSAKEKPVSFVASHDENEHDYVSTFPFILHSAFMTHLQRLTFQDTY